MNQECTPSSKLLCHMYPVIMHRKHTGNEFTDTVRTWLSCKSTSRSSGLTRLANTSKVTKLSVWYQSCLRVREAFSNICWAICSWWCYKLTWTSEATVSPPLPAALASSALSSAWEGADPYRVAQQLNLINMARTVWYCYTIIIMCNINIPCHGQHEIPPPPEWGSGDMSICDKLMQVTNQLKSFSADPDFH